MHETTHTHAYVRTASRKAMLCSITQTSDLTRYESTGPWIRDVSAYIVWKVHTKLKLWWAKGHVSAVVSQCWACVLRRHTYTVDALRRGQSVSVPPFCTTERNKFSYSAISWCRFQFKTLCWEKHSQIDLQHTKAPQMTSKPLSGTVLKGVCMN